MLAATRRGGQDKQKRADQRAIGWPARQIGSATASTTIDYRPGSLGLTMRASRWDEWTGDVVDVSSSACQKKNNGLEQ